MLFTSLEFYLFLTAVFLVWLCVPVGKRPLVLLAASYFFYAWWQPWFVLVLLFCTLVGWLAGRMMAGEPDRGQRKRILIAAVGLNLLPLLFFKYFHFFNTALRDTACLVGWECPVMSLNILLPLGLSFYTFQTIAYCTDVYQGKVEAEDQIGDFALFLAFFPKLISGPIERGTSFLPQIKRAGRFDGELLVSGIQLFLWGVFKKVVIADRLNMYVGMVFGDPHSMFGKTAVIGMWMFSIQIYCDFSAYMDMAIGCGRIFGIELSRNFNFPYMAKSIADFWRRWHITLTSWFRDYVYIPLGGRRVTTGRWVFNIMAVFLLSGLWHGAGWPFIFWGGLHGLSYLIGKFSKPVRDRLRSWLGIRGRLAAVWQVFFTFQLVSLAWVFFRARTIEDAFVLIRNMFLHPDLPVRMLSSQFSTMLAFGFALVFVVLELLIYWAERKDVDLVQAIPPVIRYPGYAVGLLVIALFGVSSHEFIYFQF